MLQNINLTNAQKDEAGVPRFKMVDGKLVEINLDYYPQDQDIRGGISVLQKLTGRDYLDYIDTFSGFPGDLFGYSIDLSNDKLIVGTPFNGFAPNKVWDWIDVSGDANALTWKLSEYGGAGAAFFFQRTGKGVNAKSQFLPFEYKDKLKPESANVGVSGGLTAINIQRQKNIGTERHQDHTDEEGFNYLGSARISNMSCIGIAPPWLQLVVLTYNKRMVITLSVAHPSLSLEKYEQFLDSFIRELT